jgi:hypothetical protein
MTCVSSNSFNGRIESEYQRTVAARVREWVSPELSTEELAHQITMAGLEVDAIDPVAGAFSRVVVAEIISADRCG